MKDNTIPLTLISLLSDGEFHSGEQLGEKLGMSRAAINKHVQTLRDWGVDVFTVPGKGYSLPEPIQLLDSSLIYSQLDGGNITVLPVIDSTNQYLMDRIGQLESGMPASLSISRPVVVVVDVNGSLPLAPICTFQCSGDWNKDRQPRLA